MSDYKKRLKELKLQYLEKTAPDFFTLSGGYKMKIAAYNDQTTNGLTKCVYDFLKHSGHYVNRINTQGQARIEKIQLAHGRTLEKLKFTPSTTNKGTADLDSIIQGKPVKIEIKCKATKDRMRDDQRKEQKKIEAAGGIYYVCRDMETFLQWYDETFNNL